MPQAAPTLISGSVQSWPEHAELSETVKKKSWDSNHLLKVAKALALSNPIEDLEAAGCSGHLCVSSITCTSIRISHVVQLKQQHCIGKKSCPKRCMEMAAANMF